MPLCFVSVHPLAPSLKRLSFAPRSRANPQPPPSPRPIRCAQSAPTAPTLPRTPSTFPPTVNQAVPYPKPAGTAGSFSALARDCDNIPQLFNKLAEHPQLESLPALIDDHHGPPVTLTFAELGQHVASVTRALRLLGLEHGDIVSFFSENSHRWCITDQAIMSCGAAAAVRGVAAPVPELRYIFENSTSCALFVENYAALKRVVSSGVELSECKFVVMLFGSSIEAASVLPSSVRLLSYDEVKMMGDSAPQTADASPSASRSDIATLLYTSGTTGNPKGVVLTHNNILRQLENISLGNLDPSPGEVFVSILPCWHVFERTASYWCLTKGVVLVYSNKRSFRDDLAKYRPHMLISVPRVFENLHATIMGRLRNAPPLRKALFSFFTTVSMAFVMSRRRVLGLDVNGGRGGLHRALDALRMALLLPLFALANLLIWRKIRAGVGGRLRMCLSGGGTIAGFLEDFFECAGIDICVGYGMTETSPVIANRFGERNVRLSTGMPMTGLEVKLVNEESGETVGHDGTGVLHVRGASVFKEYWKNSEATAKCFDADGFYNTGDLAYLTEGGDIVISGRSKDVIVLSNGENIEPQGIEDAVLGSSLIDQVMLVGQDERALGALVVPKMEELEERGLVSADLRRRLGEVVGMADGEDKERAVAEVTKEVGETAGVMEALKEEVGSRNRERDNYTNNDAIAHVRLAVEAFSVENGMLTQTLKIKRDAVSRRHAAAIAAMFAK